MTSREKHDVLSHANVNVLSKDVIIGSQPTEFELVRIFEQHHVRTVINLREESELRYSDESRVCYDHGVTYFHFPVPLQSDTWSIESTDKLMGIMELATKPIFMHCSGSSRAKTFGMLFDTTHSNDNYEEMVRELGLKEKMPMMTNFAERYLYSKLVDD